MSLKNEIDQAVAEENIQELENILNTQKDMSKREIIAYLLPKFFEAVVYSKVKLASFFLKIFDQPEYLLVTNVNGRTALHEAVVRSNVTIFELIQISARQKKCRDRLLSKADADGKTVFQLAAQCGRTHIVRKLLDHYSSQIKDQKIKALICAAQRGS